MLVVDANVVWEAAARGRLAPVVAAVIRRDPVWAAPQLCLSEVRNACTTSHRAGRLGLDDAAEILAEAERLLGGRVRTAQSRRVLELAFGTKCSAYDCEYVAVAEALGVSLITLDRQVLEAFPEIAVAPEAFLARPEG